MVEIWKIQPSVKKVKLDRSGRVLKAKLTSGPEDNGTPKKAYKQEIT